MLETVKVCLSQLSSLSSHLSPPDFSQYVGCYETDGVTEEAASLASLTPCVCVKHCRDLNRGYTLAAARAG